MKSYIHEYDRNLEREIENLKSSKVSAHNKKQILKFYNYNYSMDISKPRMIRQIGILKMTALFLKKPFGKATVSDFQDFIAHLKQLGRTPETIYTYKSTIKVFYKWLNGSRTYPECVSWFSGHKRSHTKLPESLLTQEDIKKLEETATNIRDLSLVSVLWESGARVGELGTLQLKNVAFDDMGCKILIEGKTGMRSVRLVNSAPKLLEWINEHPARNNPQSYVWVNLKRRFGLHMKHGNIMGILKRLAKRAKITKPVNPHHFRHSRATYMSQFLTEAQLKEYFGWCQESKMAARYVHLSGKQVDDAILRMHGLKKQDQKEDILKQKPCPRCKELNDHNNQYCEKCWLPLTQQAANEIEQTKQKDEEGLIGLMKILDLAENNPVKVKQALAVLKQEIQGGI